jgi:hypothetical protein
MDIVQSVALGVFLVILGLGLRANNPTGKLLAPMGLLGASGSAMYFALGRPFERVAAWLAIAILLAAALWVISLVKQQDSTGPDSPARSRLTRSRLAMIRWGADVIAAMVLLYALRKPIPVLIGFVGISIWSLFLMRRFMRDSQHASAK